MKTTIQLSRKTVQLLKDLMRRMNAKTYDEVIRAILREKYGVKVSLFGSNPRLTPFSEEEEAEFHEL
ncbi:MAG: hypothetical protein QXU02_03925 [Candidatus Bathyarchaeia archaeon]